MLLRWRLWTRDLFRNREFWKQCILSTAGVGVRVEFGVIVTVVVVIKLNA